VNLLHRWLLDLYCGPGGAALGYARAGWSVVGVDIKWQPRYPFPLVLADALSFDFSGFDAVHASPPCGDHSKSRSLHAAHGTGWMLGATRERLQRSGVPWVIENVHGAPMRPDYELCGCMFGLGVRRVRWFETSWRGFELNPAHDHRCEAVTLYGHGGQGSTRRAEYVPLDKARAAMGVETEMSARELVQAIPPAYTSYLGGLMAEVLADAA
jgi:DNA (cytosine-5)-methyltransferase 1